MPKIRQLLVNGLKSLVLKFRVSVVLTDGKILYYSKYRDIKVKSENNEIRSSVKKKPKFI